MKTAPTVVEVKILLLRNLPDVRHRLLEIGMALVIRDPESVPAANPDDVVLLHFDREGPARLLEV